MEDEAVVAAFMDATGCGREDAFDRLASCGGNLGRAIDSFFSIEAGAGPSSGRRRSRSRSPPPSSSDEEEDVAVRDRQVVSDRRSPRVSRWDSDTKVVVARSKSWRRRERRRRSRHGADYRSRLSGTADSTPGGGGGREAEADGNRSSRRRVREFREDIFSDGEDEEEDKETLNSRWQRRRLNPTELTSEGEKTKKAAAAADDDDKNRHRVREDAIVVSSSYSSDEDNNDMLEDLEVTPRPAPPPRNRTFEDLFKVHELTFKGGFHAAKAHAARQARWLLANMQSFDLPLPSLHQNRDVWGNALVARCVKDRFVLWQADAGAADADDYDADGGHEEAKKVLGYYGIPHHMLPVVVIVDPVTGQAMDVLHGSAACELNDFMVRLGPYTEMQPEIPVVAAKKSTIRASSAGAQSDAKPATTPSTTTAPTSSERAAVGSGQPQAPTTTVSTKHQPDAVVAAVSVAPTTCQARQEQAPTKTTVTEPAVAPCAGQPQQPESVAEEKVCKLRVRLADGRVVTKEFGSQCTVAALFAYCRSTLDAGAPPPEKPFRLLRFVGRATEEIGDENATFESLGLHLTTVSVQLG